ncbi:hypothetical protein K3495_g9248 [Podosphaera aphanis]|nr:hypothetical protein K3495_g9248 [Podosphaera aphanis]
MEYPVLDGISSSKKPFRVPGVIDIKVNGQLVALELPKHICQVDRGSDINLISPYLVEYLRLDKFPLAPPGRKPGVHMNTADGKSTGMNFYVKAKIRVMGITRLVELFVRPDRNVKSKDKHVLLGLPWPWSVNAFFGIRESFMLIGDQKNGESQIFIQGPKLDQNADQKLLLVPQKKNSSIDVEKAVENLTLRNKIVRPLPTIEPDSSEDNYDSISSESTDEDEADSTEDIANHYDTDSDSETNSESSGN